MAHNKYFNLCLYEVSKRAYTGLTKTWDKPDSELTMRDRRRFSTLEEGELHRQMHGHCDSLSSWRSQKLEACATSAFCQMLKNLENEKTVALKSLNQPRYIVSTLYNSNSDTLCIIWLDRECICCLWFSDISIFGCGCDTELCGPIFN